ncbi:MAG: hypothetical protein OK454_11520 [Thaumarchaeota archaeon]|nr:hypothetical protein [Nitrososphaerota archaeon]
MSTVAEAIARYLCSGEYEHDHAEWSGNSWWERAKNGHDDLLRALVAEVKKRSKGRQHHAVPDLDLTSWTRRKLTPMVQGLFPQVEREAVLALLERSVVFLTADNIEKVLLEQHWLRSAWDIANLYLGSVGADLLGPEAPSLVGLSQETTCYVSAEYFKPSKGIADYVIHESAHVFHNCKRKTAGLTETRTKEWLLLLEFRKRETFAYSCEAYGAILERAKDRAARLALAEKFAKQVESYGDDEIEPAELASIVREACEARNGWKVILSRCAPEKRVRQKVTALTSAIGE